MSFSGKVKEELARNISSARHCQIAELTAFIGMCGTVVINSFDRCSIKIRTENIKMGECRSENEAENFKQLTSN